MKHATLFAALAFFVLTGCGHGGENETTALSGDTLTHHAKWLTMVDCGDSVIAEIRSPWNARTAPARIILYPNRPFKSTVVFSSVHVGAVKELGAIDAVRGVADAQYFKDSDVVKGLKTGAVADVGNSQNSSVEAIIAIKPDAILVSPYQNSDFGALRRLGVPVVEMLDYMEDTPLGRAEWIKFLGVMYGQRQRADSIFRQVEKQYTDLKTTAAKTTTRPQVLSEVPYAGVWYVPGGHSYMARLFADAGGVYPWIDSEGEGSLPLNFETVFSKASGADVWLVKSMGPATLRTLRNDNPTLQRFKAFAPGKIWAVDTDATDFFETFPFHPELLLKDYIAIFHPETGLVPRWFAPIKE